MHWNFVAWLGGLYKIIAGEIIQQISEGLLDSGTTTANLTLLL